MAESVQLVQVLRPVLVAGAAVFSLARMVRFLTKTMLLPSTLLGRNLPQLAQFIQVANVRQLTRESIRVRSAPGTVLDAAIIQDARAGSGGKWLVYSNANGVCYEHILPYLQGLGAVLHRNVLVYNYRGVGNSTGDCQGAKDMVEDLLAVIAHVQQREGGGADILLWGHSIGGAVSALAASALPSAMMNVVADRSFASLDMVVRDKLSQGPLAALLFALMATVLAAAMALVCDFGLQITTPWQSATGSGSDLLLLRLAAAGIFPGLAARRLGLFPARVLRTVFFGGVIFQLVVGDLILSRWAYDSVPIALLFVYFVAFEFAQQFPELIVRALQHLVKIQGWVMQPASVIGSGLRGKLVCTFIPGDEMITEELSLAQCKGVKSVALDGPSGALGQGANLHMHPLSEAELRRIERALF